MKTKREDPLRCRQRRPNSYEMNLWLYASSIQLYRTLHRKLVQDDFVSI